MGDRWFSEKEEDKIIKMVVDCNPDVSDDDLVESVAGVIETCLEISMNFSILQTVLAGTTYIGDHFAPINLLIRKVAKENKRKTSSEQRT